MALLRNSSNANGVLTRSIAIDPITMAPRMVLKAVRGSGEKCTQQEIKTGDLVIMCTHGQPKSLNFLRANKVNRYRTHLSKITDGDLTMSIDGDFLKLMTLMDGTLFKWLTDSDESPYLPANFGWDGKRTRYEKAKFEEFTQLLEDVTFEYKDELIEWAMLSQRENVNVQWNTAQAIPSSPIYLPPAANIKMHLVITWMKNGEVQVATCDNNDYSTQSLTVANLLDDEVEKAIVCTVLSNKYGRNLRWKLYRR